MSLRNNLSSDLHYRYSHNYSHNHLYTRLSVQAYCMAFFSFNGLVGQGVLFTLGGYDVSSYLRSCMSLYIVYFFHTQICDIFNELGSRSCLVYKLWKNMEYEHVYTGGKGILHVIFPFSMFRLESPLKLHPSLSWAHLYDNLAKLFATF